MTLIDRWDDPYNDSKYLTIGLNDTERVDVKRCLDDYEDSWFTYIMDCDNGMEVYEENIEGSGCEWGIRHLSWDEEKAVMDFVAEQVRTEEELDEKFERSVE